MKTTTLAMRQTDITTKAVGLSEDNEHAADDRQQGGNGEAPKNKNVHRLQRREYKHRQNKQHS